MTKRQNLNTELQPCNEENSDGFYKCLVKNITDYIGCDIPWMKPPGQNATECSPEQLLLLKELTQFPLRHSNAETFKSCGCLTPCTYYEYWAEFSETADTSLEMAGTAFVGFYSLSYKIPVYTQVFDYTGSDFVADAGGYLGLLLGTSFLSLYNEIGAFISRISLHRDPNRVMNFRADLY